MILIDALYINNGGGKVLLDYLISNLEKTDKKIFYLFDVRVKNNLSFDFKESNTVVFLKASMMNRFKFYNQNKKNFTTVLCFGNLPPNIRLEGVVYTYFHQLMYLSVPIDFSYFDKLKFWLKVQVLTQFKKNTNIWLVQSNIIKQKFIAKYNINEKQVLICPFYPPIFKENQIERKKHTYIYVSNPTPHKNHLRLIEAFCDFYDSYKKGKLILTIDDSNQEVNNLLNLKKDRGYPIVSIGFVSREKLMPLYCESEYLIFPSLAESFGLGLVEAIECGCKILGADLPYMHEICEPSLVFNPYDKQAIYKCLSLSLETELPPSKSKINNKINDLLDLLK
ncbi:glycosyltransferase [Flavobacterium luminosum]|uniref:Glycosyltransferase n=1 Tax=Flavobacterium luminosum TaxID=2949086 RepID=A0ABT0TNP1_9FLAO|nr:glycosyltransferase [Flavobacterium sp. HXWNR70]MCL9809118.1 glycosyltransferase [Flavobacterium sp. HXWNR70]